MQKAPVDINNYITSHKTIYTSACRKGTPNSAGCISLEELQLVTWMQCRIRRVFLHEGRDVVGVWISSEACRDNISGWPILLVVETEWEKANHQEKHDEFLDSTKLCRWCESILVSFPSCLAGFGTTLYLIYSSIEGVHLPHCIIATVATAPFW